MELYSREFGQGSPVLILHGLFGFSDNWQTIAKGLSDQHLVVTPDLRNHGRSPHVPTHTYAEMADDLRAFMEAALDVQRCRGGAQHGRQSRHATRLVAPGYGGAPGGGRYCTRCCRRQPFFHFSTPYCEMDLSKMSSRQEAETYLAERIPDAGTRQFLLKNITREEDGRFAWKMNLPVLWEHYR
ncbi:MAG: alpha/beta fold hydrolase [Dermatophilaceae bacterium]